jgi:hypothetical protein
MPKIEDCLAERSGFELSVPLVYRETPNFRDFHSPHENPEENGGALVFYVRELPMEFSAASA